MGKENVTITSRQVRPDIGAIDISGELTAFAEDALMQAFYQAAQGDASAVVLNFSGLEYMTSSGIGLLVTLFIRANRLGCALYAVGLNTHYQRIFNLTRLNETIPVCSTEEELLEELSGVSGP